MGGKGSGNKRAHGQIGHKGGTGRPPKPETRCRHRMTFFLSDAQYDALMVQATRAGFDSWRDFLRSRLT